MEECVCGWLAGESLGLAVADGGRDATLCAGDSGVFLMSQHERPLRTCPKCGHPGLELPRCPMCAWQPEPPPEETLLLVDDQVVTVRWRVLAGVPVGEPIDTRSLWDWVQQHQR